MYSKKRNNLMQDLSFVAQRDVYETFLITCLPRREGGYYGTTAERITTVLNPERSVTDSFAWNVAAIGDSLRVGSPFQSSDLELFSQDRVAYLFQPGR